jgi:hypothetical protein
MMHRPARWKMLSAAAACLLGLLHPSALVAEAPGLNAILDRLESNLHRYDAGLPSLFCQEHVVSAFRKGDLPPQITTTDSIFRLRRTVAPNHSISLAESREVERVNGRAPQAGDPEGPTRLSRLFEGGIAVVSRSQAPCMRYTLSRHDTKKRADPYVVRFATEPDFSSRGACFFSEDTAGSAEFDPDSLGLERLHFVTPRHILFDGSAFAPPIVGKREVDAKYAPVDLGGETFSLPATIEMRAVNGFGFHRLLWTFRATYSQCHRMEVTSRIVPGSEVDLQERDKAGTDSRTPAGTPR